jgi:hypothetical protein
MPSSAQESNFGFSVPQDMSKIVPDNQHSEANKYFLYITQN